MISVAVQHADAVSLDRHIDARAAMALVRDATAVNGEIIDER